MTAGGHTSIPTDQRIIDLDVVRGVALVGVCVMNYHGYLLLRGANPGHGFLARLFSPWDGPLATRFAAAFVVVAGMGVSLLTRRSTAAGDSVAISRDRWVLIRRGVLLFSFGFFLDWVWPGTILFFYGAYFLVGAAVFTLRTRWLVALGVAAAGSAAAIQWWVVDRRAHGHPTDWLTSGNASTRRSPRELVLDTFVRGTHPLLPWLLFLCAGMVIGRSLPFDRRWRIRLAGIGASLLAVGYGLHHVAGWHPILRSTHPFDRGIFYSLAALGAALGAISLVGWIAAQTATTAITQMLAVTGRTTLTLYVLHALVFDLFVDRLKWVHPGGLATSLVFAAAFWSLAFAFANVWHLWKPVGPLERVYRQFS